MEIELGAYYYVFGTVVIKSFHFRRVLFAESDVVWASVGPKPYKIKGTRQTTQTLATDAEKFWLEMTAVME